MLSSFVFAEPWRGMEVVVTRKGRTVRSDGGQDGDASVQTEGTNAGSRPPENTLSFEAD